MSSLPGTGSVAKEVTRVARVKRSRSQKKVSVRRRQAVQREPAWHWRLGSVLISMGDLKGALDAFQKVLPVREQLMSADPRDLRAVLNLARSHDSIAFVLMRMGVCHTSSFKSFVMMLSRVSRLGGRESSARIKV